MYKENANIIEDSKDTKYSIFFLESRGFKLPLLLNEKYIYIKNASILEDSKATKFQLDICFLDSIPK